MFTLTRIIGVVNAGALQPSQVQVVGDWVCPGGANNGIALEFRITSPSGAPTTTFTAVTNNGANGPVGSVVFLIPAWPGATCGMKFAGEVRGLCNGVMTPWEPVHSEDVSCLGCPRIQMNAPSYAACAGTTQDVTLSATVMLPPGQSSAFSWDFGDGNTLATGVITNNTGNVNHPLTITTTHAYADSATPYQACLIPGNAECPRVCVDVQTTCTTTGCPAITGAVSYGSCTANNTRPTTYTLTFNPPLPANTSAQVSWAYGAANAAGLTTATQTINTSGGPLTTAQHTTDLAHRSGGYNTTATVVLVIGGQLCPLATSTVSIFADPPTCLPCPTPGNPITVTITTPNTANWCAPLAAGQAAMLSTQVNWQAPVPANAPVPLRYDWTVTSPAGGPGTATRQGGSTVATDSGWSGAGATATGAIDLRSPGSYTVSVAAVFSPASGLPTDASGAITCTLVGGASFNLQACQGSTDCPQITGLTPTVGCIDSAGTPATVSVLAAVDDPTGSAQSFVWDFGDPQSAGNQTTTATPNAAHDYAAPGIYTVSCRVTSNAPNCTPRGATVFARTVTVAACPPPVVVPPPKLTGCAALLWTSLIFMLVGLLLLLAGCLVSVFVPAPPGPVIGAALAIAGGVALLVGIILFIIWWAVCRFLTECSVILAGWTFMGVMIAVFGVIAAVIGIMALFGLGTLPCFVGAVVSFGYWGFLYWIMSQIALEVGCLTANPGGSAPPTSSSSSGPLTGSGSSNKMDSSRLSAGRPHRQTGALHITLPGVRAAQPVVGLGDLITKATSAVGIRPCQACHERAARLNHLASVGGSQNKA